jgi:3-oxoacyl-(acyl-carrier-protein) synthase/thioesterase domain-containing protein
MGEINDRLSRMSAIQLALAAREARARAELVNAEPIAIVGAGCRFPGNANNPESFWRLLRQGCDSIGEIPADRWDVDAFYDPTPQTPGKMISRRGGFVEHLREFDADFFGISPREAVSLDPQQRTLLEVTWETLENAGVPADSLVGSNTGVFVGISGIDYFMHIQACNYEMDAYVGTGNALSVASGRLSHLFGLQGPSVSVDTACSSSLVAVHMACQSLRNRECDLALAGGTHRIILPYGSVGLSQARLLAPDGRCKTFDAKADGYVRGEGCGMVLLKRLSDAIADRDNIAALLRGSAVNQDGKTSGLTVPNGPSQQAVIRKALRNAAVDAGQIGYVEAHGTGTPLGDPIEVTALASVFGERRSRQAPLLIGSVKTNFGHLEAAAGIAGLLKLVLALQHNEIPPHLNLDSPSPYISWQSIPIKVTTAVTPWPAIDGRRIGSVSSFSFSGTNAHAVVEQTPPALLQRERAVREFQPAAYVLTLSAKTPGALRELASRYEEHLAGTDQAFEDICYTSNTGRSHFSQRLSVVADSSTTVRRGLVDWLSCVRCPSVFEGRRTKAPKIGFYFAEDIPEADRIARQLYDGQPAIEETLKEADGLWRTDSLWSRDPALKPAATFALQVALTRMWRALGIEPGVVTGSGIGRFAAACAAGVFSFRAGVETLANSTGVSALFANGLSAPRIALLCAATGKRLNNEVHQADYWTQCLDNLQRDNISGAPETFACDVVLGIGMTRHKLEQLRGNTPLAAQFHLPTLSDDGSDWLVSLDAIATLYTAGASLKWDALYAHRSPRRVAVPTYPFQRERYWIEGAPLTVPAPQPPTAPGAAGRALDREILLAAADGDRRKLLESYISGQLAAILKRPEALIGPEEPLHLLGVDSLMAAELKYKIENDLSVSLEIQGVNEDYCLDNLIDSVLAALTASHNAGPDEPTISVLRNNEGEPVGSLLAAHEQGARAPLLFVHPGGIEISTYTGLVPYLDPDQPLYVLQPHGLYENFAADDGAGFALTIEQAAAFSVTQLLRMRSEGPFFVAGWSLGALVAYETARQLKAAGHEVPVLFLIDVMCGPARDGTTLVAWFADLLGARTGRRLDFSLSEWSSVPLDQQIEAIWAKAIAAEVVHASMPLTEFTMLFERYRDALAASSVRADLYKLSRELCADRVIFLNSEELSRPERRRLETVFDWTEGVGGPIEIHMVPGNHYSMLFEPSVKDLAAGIQGSLDRMAPGRAVFEAKGQG